MPGAHPLISTISLANIAASLRRNARDATRLSSFSASPAHEPDTPTLSEALVASLAASLWLSHPLDVFHAMQSQGHHVVNTRSTDFKGGEVGMPRVVCSGDVGLPALPIPASGAANSAHGGAASRGGPPSTKRAFHSIPEIDCLPTEIRGN